MCPGAVPLFQMAGAMEVDLGRSALCVRAKRACVREASVSARQRACVKAVVQSLHAGRSLTRRVV